jgi:hypothetical protein
MSSALRFLCAALLLTGEVGGESQWESKVDEQGRNVQQLKIQAPSMTEEDQYSSIMPDQYRCDSCKVVAYHLSEALKRKQPKNRRLKSWEYTELFDETCKTGFSGYGVAFVDGQNVLSGPALKRDNLEPGMGAIQMGGQTWELRLGEICRRFVYEKIGEDEVYEHFRSKGEVSSDLCFSDTRDCRTGPNQAKNVAGNKKSSDEEAITKKTEDVKVKKAENIDVDAFMSRLAKKHGIAPAEYKKKRSFGEWEQFLVQVTKKMSPDASKETSQVMEV